LKRCAALGLLGFLATGVSHAQTPSTAQWTQSYAAGYVDAQGAYAGGSEIMHLVAHKGKVYAANGYWVDAHWVIPPDHEKQSAQVLRLDAPNTPWQVDLELGRSDDERDLLYMKGNILKSVTFTRDGSGKPLPEPQNLLVMAAGANIERGGAVSAWVRDDASETWTHTLVRHGSNAGGIRWVPRDLELYRDTVTGVEHVILSLGNPGIASGVYDDSEPGKIRWNAQLEYPFPELGSLTTRPLGMVQANGALYFSEGDAIYRRVDGPRPSYTKVLDLEEDTDTDIGGIRGLTTIPHPHGPGDSLLFLWAPPNGSQSQIKRLDPDGQGSYTVHDEANLAEMMKQRLGADIPYTLGAHNMMYAVVDPASGETVHLIGFQGNIKGQQPLRWNPSALYAGAQYAIRFSDQTYQVHEVNNVYAPGKPPLITPRAFCLSPFGDGHLYIGGHDASRHISDDMAWIFNAPIPVVLGRTPALDASPPPRAPPPAERLLQGPVYELRIYAAAEGRHRDLIKRFKEHTDRIFKKHRLESIGYWIPTDGTYQQKRKVVYILKHASRYDAYKNWNAFSRDGEWEAVIDQPLFKGLLSESPTSIFMTEQAYSAAVAEAIQPPGGVFELRTYTAHPGKLDELNARFKDHTTRLFTRHGMKHVGYWTPFDEPESANTLIYLIHHARRAQADGNWKGFLADPEWKAVAEASQTDGPLLAKPPERLYLKALDFSPLQ
jgi:hypothetical protein